MNPDPQHCHAAFIFAFVCSRYMDAALYTLYTLANNADLPGLPGLPGYVSPVCGQVPTGGGHAAQGAPPRHRSFYACLNYLIIWKREDGISKICECRY
jgi:hypothetical protein